MRIALVNAELLDPELPEPVVATLLVEGGRIVERLDPTQKIPEGTSIVNLFGAKIAPGFIDLHVHDELPFLKGIGALNETRALRSTGALATAPEVERDGDDADDAIDALTRMSASCLRHGTTAFLPTTVSADPRHLTDFVTRVASTSSSAYPGARPIGVHLEGPWINPAAAGAQPPGPICGYASPEGRSVLDAAQGVVAMVTLAPEIEGARLLVDDLRSRGVVAALGHSLAGRDDLDAAVARGMTHVTHLFNAMGPIHHRQPGVAGYALTEDRLTCDLICDGVHVHPSMVALAARALGERLLLITDRLRAPDTLRAHAGGTAPTPGSPAAAIDPRELRDDGQAFRLADGRLAGSTLGLNRAVDNLRHYAGVSLLEAVRACTLRPARLLGVESARGTLRDRARADFAVLDDRGALLETWLEGRRVYEAPQP